MAIVSEWVDAWRGGAETSTLQFLHHLMDRGVEVHLFTRSRPSPTHNLEVHVIPGAGMGRTRKTVLFTHRVDRAIREYRFDIVHAISPCLAATVFQPRGGTIAETIERNLALRPHRATRSLKRMANRLNFKQRYLLGLERRIMAPGGPVIVALSDYVVRQLKKHYDLPDQRIRKIFNGIDPDRTPPEKRAEHRRAIRSEFRVDDDQLLALIVAHNFRLKGVESWLRTLAARRTAGQSPGGPPIRTLIVGKGDDHRWKEKARRLGIQNDVVFAGPSDRVDRFRHACDFAVHLTFYDPCSRVVLESLASGVPCITSAWDGAAELIRHGMSGFVVDDPHDILAVNACIDRLADADTRAAIGRAAADAAAACTMARHAGEMMDLYDELTTVGGPV